MLKKSSFLNKIQRLVFASLSSTVFVDQSWVSYKEVFFLESKFSGWFPLSLFFPLQFRWSIVSFIMVVLFLDIKFSGWLPLSFKALEIIYHMISRIFSNQKVAAFKLAILHPWRLAAAVTFDTSSTMRGRCMRCWKEMNCGIGLPTVKFLQVGLAVHTGFTTIAMPKRIQQTLMKS